MKIRQLEPNYCRRKDS